VFEAVSILWLDRPVAAFFHDNGEPWRPACELIQRLGFGTPYLVLFAVTFAGLRWGGNLPPLRPWAAPMRAAAAVPAFLFAAVAVSGLTVDLLKVIFGRARPKLLFAAGTYDFSWLGLGADHWSFPSGHAATAAALMTALWCLWPRHVLFYVILAAIVAASRVAIGAHYLSDVMMGAFVAVLVTRALAAIFGHFRALPIFQAQPRQPVLPPS
jgi:undecaprenyl-diphosphatase